MRVLIAGGSGLIGNALAASLFKDGHQVVVLSRRPNQPHRLPEGVHLVGWDGRTSTGWLGSLDGADALVNLAGDSIATGVWTSRKKERMLHSRLDVGHAIVEAMQRVERKPALLIQASGIGYYGPLGDQPVAESDPPGADWLSGVAVQWEASTSGVRELGVRWVGVRTGLVLSRDGGLLPQMLLPYRLSFPSRIGSGRQVMSWIHMADEVAALRFLLETPGVEGVFNLTAPAPVTNAEFSRVLAKALHQPAWMPVPAFPIRALLGEKAALLLTGQRVLPTRLMALGFDFEYPQLDAALADLLRRR